MPEQNSLKELLEEGCSYLLSKDIAEYKIDAWRLLEYVFDIRRTDYLTEPGRLADIDRANRYYQLIKQRGTHYPLQYITGCQEFMGLDFKVDESVLIPRQDTETLVECVLEAVSGGEHLLDMCTGSGCIIISLSHYGNFDRAVGVDVSEAALETARYNAGQHHQDKIEFIQSDLFENVTGRYHIIVSNPPYIKAGEIAGLMSEVKDYEPVIALNGHEDGLAFYRRITEESKEYLVPGGVLFFEIGCEQAEDVSRIFEQNGFAEPVIKKDLAGLDRIIYAVKN